MNHYENCADFLLIFFYVAFVQTDNHLTYIGDGRDINGIPLEVSPNLLIFLRELIVLMIFVFMQLKSPN